MAQEKGYIYAEAYNGLTVRVPADQYEKWSKEQELYRTGKKKPQADPEMVAKIMARLRGK